MKKQELGTAQRSTRQPKASSDLHRAAEPALGSRDPSAKLSALRGLLTAQHWVRGRRFEDLPVPSPEAASLQRPRHPSGRAGTGGPRSPPHPTAGALPPAHPSAPTHAAGAVLAGRSEREDAGGGRALRTARGPRPAPAAPGRRRRPGQRRWRGGERGAGGGGAYRRGNYCWARPPLTRRFRPALR